MIFIIIIVFLCAKGGAETDCFFFGYMERKGRIPGYFLCPVKEGASKYGFLLIPSCNNQLEKESTIGFLQPDTCSAWILFQNTYSSRQPITTISHLNS